MRRATVRISHSLRYRLTMAATALFVLGTLVVAWQLLLLQRELSQRAHLTEPTAHAALTKLEKQGVITRQKMDGNKRTLRIFLTPKGWEQMRAVVVARGPWDLLVSSPLQCSTSP